MALTATANIRTQTKVKKSLEMNDCKIVTKIPNNLNIFYSLLPMPLSPQEVLDPLVDELCKYGTKSKRTIVFCRSYDTLLGMYEYTVLQVNERGALFAGTPQPGKQSLSRICDKYDACTSLEVRQNILSSFTQVDGNVRLIFATIAFAMGLDAPDVRRIIHWSPPDDIEMYIQESGRGGRDGKPSIAVLYVNNKKVRHTLDEMKVYCSNTTVCRRALLMSSFDTSSKSISKPTPLHMCCDICSMCCTCSRCTNPLLGFQSLTEFEVDDVSHELVETNRVPSQRRFYDSAIKDNLLEYRSKIIDKFGCPNVALMVGYEIASGLTDYVIDTVSSEAYRIQSESDLIQLGVPTEHASPLLNVIQSHEKE